MLLHLLIPLAGSLAFIPVLLAAFGINFAGLGIGALATPGNYAPYVVYAWMAAGALLLAYFASTDRTRIERVGAVFTEQIALGAPQTEAEADKRDREH